MESRLPMPKAVTSPRHQWFLVWLPAITPLPSRFHPRTSNQSSFDCVFEPDASEHRAFFFGRKSESYKEFINIVLRCTKNFAIFSATCATPAARWFVDRGAQ